MTFNGRKIYISLLLFVGLFARVIPVDAQQPVDFAAVPDGEDISLNYKTVLKQGLGDEYIAVLEKLFGADAQAAAAAFQDNSPELFEAVRNGAATKAADSLEQQINERRQNKGSAFKMPAAAKKPVKSPSDDRHRKAKGSVSAKPQRSVGGSSLSDFNGCRKTKSPTFR